MFSYPFYLRMQQNTPEFEELAAFQAGGVQFSTRRGESDRMAKPLRGEFVAAIIFLRSAWGRSPGGPLLPPMISHPRLRSPC